MANVASSTGTTRKGGSETLVVLDDPKQTKVWRPTNSLGGGGGGGDSGGGGGYDPLSELSPGEAMSYAKMLGEGGASYPQITQQQIDTERGRVSGIYSPFYDAQRAHLKTVEEGQRTEAKITRETIADNYDDALGQLREQYNRRGLFFSGQELNEEARTGRDKANALTRTDLALQQTLSEIGVRGAELTLKQQQAIEDEIKNYISSQSQINEGVGKANAARLTSDLATRLLEGVGGRLANERNAAAAEKDERLRLAQSEEARGFASLLGEIGGVPTLAGRRQQLDESYFPYRVALAERTLSTPRGGGGGGGGGGGAGNLYGRFPTIPSDVAQRYSLPFNTSKEEYDLVRLIINRQVSSGHGWGETAEDLRASGVDPTMYDNLLWEQFTGKTKRNSNASSSSSGSGWDALD